MAATPRRAGSLFAAITAGLLAGAGFGMALPLLSLNLEAQTGSGAAIGFVGAAGSVSTVLVAPFAPRVLQRIPGRVAIAGAFLLTAALTLLFRVFESVPAWALLRLLMGVAVTIPFIASEVWINQLATDRDRGKLIGLYGGALAAGFASGGLVISVLGTVGWAPFLVAASIFGFGALPLLSRGPGIEPPKPEEATLRAMLKAARYAPTPAMAALAFGAVETAVFLFLPVYGVRIGLGEAGAALLLGATSVGTLAFQVPLGWLSDQMDRARLLRCCAGGAAVAPLLMPLAQAWTPALYALAFVYGGMAVGLYTLGLSLLGDRFKGGAMAAANASFVFLYGVGSLASPALGGYGIDAWNPHGVLLVLSGFALVLVIVAYLRAAKAR
ncbi:MAG: MFS transporter [Maricaulaceae bacterium]